MPTSTQYFNAMTQTSYLASGINYWYELNSTQTARLNDAMRLWDDVSNFSAIPAVDDPNLARASTTVITEYFLGIPIRSYWENSLPNEWTRVAVGDIADPNTLGINKSYGDNNRYHEVFIDLSNEGVWSFQLGSRANYTLLHEIGHSIVGGHLSGGLTQTLMQPSATNDPSEWYPSTPMTLDIDQAIAMYGAPTTTRTGNDVYGFNASLSGGYRAAFDFSVNTRPLVTIFDNGGYDTLDASGFYDGSFNPRSVVVNLGQGAESYLMSDGQTFAVIYRTTWIEAAVSGGGDDYLVGNALANSLTAGAGDDWINALGGSDSVYGGTGTDTAGFSSDSSTYAYWINGDGTIGVSGADGNDLLDSIQRLSFSNGTFDLWQLGLDDGAADAATTRGLTLGLATPGSIETKGDHDWFGVDLVAGATYRFSLNGSASNDGTLSDGFLTLRDGYGSALQSDDDSGPGFDARLVYTATFSGSHFLDAYAYSDYLIGSYQIAAVARQSLTGASNSFTGESSAEWILGLGGNDTLKGMAGDDLLDGGSGSDVLRGDEGDDDLIGGPGGDTYLFDTDLALGTDVLDESGGGTDTLNFGSTTTRPVTVDLANGWSQVVNAGLTLVLGSGTTFEKVIGGALADTLTGNTLANTFTAGGGNDTLTGGAGKDTYVFDTDLALGTDTLDESGGGVDTLDFSATTTRSVSLNLANAGAQVVNAGLTVALGSNATFENVTGGALADTLIGNALANKLAGGGGNDALIGGGGDDTFWFTSAPSAAGNADFVGDFVAADDRFLLDQAAFSGIGPIGQLVAANFAAGSAAGDASDRVIYNALTGQLYFDADGSGAGAQVLFATVLANTALGFNDIWIG